MSNLGPQRQKASYAGLLQVPGGITSTLQTVQDGNGNATGLQLSTTSVSALGIVSNTAQNVYGGSAGQLVYQTGVSTTGFVSTGTTGQFLQSNGLATPTFVSVTASTVGALPTTGGAMTGAIDMNANLISDLATPVASTDAATKGYVDSVAVGLQTKTAVTCASTADIPTLSGLLTIDGITVTAGQRVLVKDQSTQANNGIYVAAAGAWSRSTDADTWAELVGAAVFVSSGTANAGSTWVTNIPSSGTIGVTAIVWNQFSATGSYTAGTGLALAGNQFSLITPVSIANGGTNSTATPTAGAVAYGTGSAIGYTSAGSSGQLLQSNGSSAPTFATVNVSTLGACAASVKPSSNGTFYSGSVSRLVTDMFGDMLSIKDFGAVANDVSAAAANTTAIQTAINNCGGAIHIPAGKYYVSGTISIPTQFAVYGESSYITEICSTSLSTPVLSMTGGTWTTISGLRVSYNGTPTAGAVAIYNENSNATIENVIISESYIGIEITAGTGVQVNNFHIEDYNLYGLYVHNTNDVFIDNFLFVTSKTGAVGIRLYNRMEAFLASNGDIIGGLQPLQVDSASNVSGSRPAYNSFVSVYFDSGTSPAYLNNTAITMFSNCWFSNGRTASAPGAYLDVTDTITFTNCTFFNSGSYGALVQGGSVSTIFNGCVFEGNSYDSVGTYAGLAFGSGASKFNVIGCVSKTGPTNGQSYGILVASGCNDFTIVGNQLTGNTTGGLNDGTSSTTRKHIQNNTGTNVGSAPGYKYNDVTASRSAGTSYTNNTIEPILVEISANCPPGTTAEVGLQITESGSTKYLSSSIPSVGAGVYGVTTLVGYVPPGGSYKCVTYIGSPTFATWYESSGTCN